MDIHSNPTVASNLAKSISYDKIIADYNPFFNKKILEYPT